MQATELFDSLAARGIRLVSDGSTLRAVAPAGVISDADRIVIFAHKTALLALLQQQRKQGVAPASDNDNVLSDAGQLPVSSSPSICTCGAVFTIEHFAGWEHRYCPAGAGSHRHDSWARVSGDAPLTRALTERLAMQGNPLAA